MAQTSDERREVAKRLRELDHEITSYDTIENGVNKLKKAVHGNTSFSPIEYSVRNLCGLANTLADIIDPTCHVVIPNEMDGECFCSECGALLGEYGYTAYCPSCGARVVNGNAEDD